MQGIQTSFVAEAVIDLAGIDPYRLLSISTFVFDTINVWILLNHGVEQYPHLLELNHSDRVC